MLVCLYYVYANTIYTYCFTHRMSQHNCLGANICLVAGMFPSKDYTDDWFFDDTERGTKVFNPVVSQMSEDGWIHLNLVAI